MKKETPMNADSGGSGRPAKIGAFSLSALFVLALFYTLYFARSILLPVALALFFSFLLRPLVRLLKSVRVPEYVSAALILIAILAVAGFGIVNLSGPALEWVDKAPESLEQMGSKVQSLLAPFKEATRTLEELRRITGGRELEKLTVQPGPSLVRSFLSGFGAFLAQAAVMLVLLFFILASGDFFLRKLMDLYRSEEKQREVAEVVREVERSISRYLVTATFVNMGEGLFVGLGMKLIGLPDPVLWGVMAAFLVFIPYLGPLVGILVVTVVALLTLDDIMVALLAPLAYFVVTSIQGQFVTPLVLGVRFRMHPVIILTWLIFWGGIWGIVGAVLAVPMLTIFKILSDHIAPLRPVSRFLSR